MCILESGYLVKTHIMEGYALYLVNVRRILQSRAEIYVNLVRKFHNHVGKPYNDIIQSDIRSYISYLKATKHLTDRSLYEHLSAIKNFYEYLWIRGDVTKIPCDGININYWKNRRSPKNPKKLPITRREEDLT